MTDLERQLATFEPVKELIDPARNLVKAETKKHDDPSLWVLHTGHFWANIPENTALDIRIGQAKRWIDRWLLRDVPVDWTFDCHWCRSSTDDYPTLRHLATIIRTTDCRDGPDMTEELEDRSLPELYARVVAWMHEHSEHEKNLRAIRRAAARATVAESKILAEKEIR